MIQFKCAIISAAFLLGGMTTGYDMLGIGNLKTYDESMVWEDLNLAQAYVNNLYEERFEGWSVSTDQNSDQTTGIPWYLDTITETGGDYKKQDYTKTRHINEAIFKLKSSVIEGRRTVNFMLGQAYFMRAYMYYWIVLHHGGIPYLKVPQDRDKGDLCVKHNSTPKCFQFMIEDLDHAVSLLPAKAADSSSDYGRIGQCLTKSWKAKTLLLKASPQFNPKRMYDNAYWREAYVAAKGAYDFCVQNGIALTENPANIRLQERDPEVVFPVIYSNPNRVTIWEYGTHPASVNRDKPYRNPTWKFVEGFPMLDDRRYGDPTGRYYVGDERALLKAFWKNYDPRFSRACLYNGREQPAAGRSVDSRMYNALGVNNADDQYGVNPNADVNAANNDIFSGMYNYKVSDLSLTQDKAMTSDINYISTHFVEMMFIYAEVANEDGHSDVAIDLLKQIRRRAGVEAGADGLYGLKAGNREEIRQTILDERYTELRYEGHRFWDLCRTCNMIMLAGWTKHGIEAIAVNPDGSDMGLNIVHSRIAGNELTIGDFHYVIYQVPYTEAAERQLVIEESFYFFLIKKTYLDENPGLEQNNNQEGTFSPTMEQ